MKRLLLLQSALLLFGTFFAWYTVANDYLRFLNKSGVNPLTTPCFYGAVGFILFFTYSVYIYFESKEKRIRHQKILMVLLVGGTIFGWTNFIIELCSFYIFKNPTSCSGTSTISPFLTACFYGSVIYLLSLVASIFTFKKLKVKTQKI